MDIDINTLRGLSTLAVLTAFIGLVIWAYSSRRRKSFDEAAQLPFADDEAHRQTMRNEREQAQMKDAENRRNG